MAVAPPTIRTTSDHVHTVDNPPHTSRYDGATSPRVSTPAMRLPHYHHLRFRCFFSSCWNFW
ncbi:Uncharacterised protein [Mycobacterium tuberculosis]|uniref:Uncharacterized protein n=1 Tax=Mycobacterium tuberculosis TaxID=1773 RepID=A0A0U0T9S7_MYCTX|nr:Uncharacterised protein [Mycobacterium tuberculosis]COX70804.1 Uncharacterised protein [Mycobacterium tuberculosis]COY70047.1 Uncharacterised protein [Mycobacterium tuberculosis]COZ23840.1 Uncharacterised protein [Mycobacterium tuberculosis]